VTTHRPLSGHRGTNRRGLGTTGRAGLSGESSGQGGDGYYGTKKQGSRHVIGGKDRRTGPGGQSKSAAPLNLSRSAAAKKKSGG
jgi:hypothetical protein